jgi:hypothetical protein
MTVWQPRLAAQLFSAATCVAQAADCKITIEDLTQRAADWYLRLAKTGDGMTVAQIAEAEAQAAAWMQQARKVLQ